MAEYNPDEFFSAERKPTVKTEWKDAFDIPDEITFKDRLRFYGIEMPNETNADRIRAMSDEELADEIEDWFWVMYNHEIAHDDIVSWLKSPVEGTE